MFCVGPNIVVCKPTPRQFPLSPLRYYMDIIGGIFRKGAGLAVLWDEASALLVIGVALFILSLWVFRRRVQ